MSVSPLLSPACAGQARAMRLPVPPRLYVPLFPLAEAGLFRLRVAPGQKILKGECLAAAGDGSGSAIHASTSGVVRAIGEVAAAYPAGQPMVAATIDADGDDRWIDAEAVAEPFDLGPADLARQLAGAGVAGGRLRGGIDTLIVKGGEGEAHLSGDERLMRDKAPEVIKGIGLLLHASRAREALVAIEDNRPEAIAEMRKAAEKAANIRICPVPAGYPMASKRLLAARLAGGSQSLVEEVATAYAAWRAICLGRPVVSRLVTVNGGAVFSPGNYEVAIGTTVADIIAFTGGFRGEPARLVMAGVAMGNVLPHARVPVAKGTSGILALTAAEVADAETRHCVRCGSCLEVCPQGLAPREMAATIRAGQLEAAGNIGLAECIACGSCAYVCSSGIPLTQYFHYAKAARPAPVPHPSPCGG